jgi:biopolymer transport protein TolR
MAMGLGSQRGLVGQMNVTPMIDVLLVLIIIFMIITPSSTGLDALIPQPSPHSPPPQPESTIVIQVLSPPNHSGPPQLRINQDYVTWENLSKALDDIYKSRAERVAFVKGDSDIEYEYVASVIDIAHHAGVDHIGLITGKVEDTGAR